MQSLYYFCVLTLSPGLMGSREQVRGMENRDSVCPAGLLSSQDTEYVTRDILHSLILLPHVK